MSTQANYAQETSLSPEILAKIKADMAADELLSLLPDNSSAQLTQDIFEVFTQNAFDTALDQVSPTPTSFPSAQANDFGKVMINRLISLLSQAGYSQNDMVVVISAGSNNWYTSDRMFAFPSNRGTAINPFASIAT